MMYYVLCKKKHLRGKHAVGCYKLVGNEKSVVTDGVKFLLQHDGASAYESAVVLTEREAKLMHDNLGRKLAENVGKK
jgi:hypothetical protein